MKKSKTPKAGASSAPRAGWPLPPEWDTFIPPQATLTVQEQAYVDGRVCGTMTLQRWNAQWLRGLEAYVRSIVRDELRKADIKCEPLAPAGESHGQE